jgi:hypothetical protein
MFRLLSGMVWYDGLDTAAAGAVRAREEDQCVTTA